MAQERIHQLFGKYKDLAIFRHMKCFDQLGQPFHYELEMLSTKADLSPYDAVGETMAVGIVREGQPVRYFHGMITGFRYEGQSGGYHLYTVDLRPTVWTLKYSSDCRIFQNKSVPDIIEVILKKHNISDLKRRLKSYEPREYCVQYRESDFDFISRLMEQEGIYYYFEHEQSKHTIVLVDDNTGVPKINGDASVLFRPPNELAAAEEHVFQWAHHVEIQTGTTILRDFDYNKSATQLEANSNTANSHVKKKLTQYDYPGEFLVNDEGTRYAKLFIQSHDSNHSYVRGQAHSYRLVAGSRFSLAEHPVSKDNMEYLVVGSESTIHSGEIEQLGPDSKNYIEVRFRAIPQTKPYRSPRVTPPPIIAGPQTAKVVGKSGEEIWTDNLGRVRVQFPWDREGKSDENSSCWIRVAQFWAGKGWGSLHLPRIGQEVVVEFLEGDPDRPLITGRVYNNEQTPPYALPDMQTHSGIKSRSTKEGDEKCFNELRFEDTKGQELIYFHAEKDFTRVVENNDSLKVGLETKDKGNQTIEIFNDQIVKIGQNGAENGSQTVEIWKDQTETIKTGDRTVTIEAGSDTLTITQGDQKIDISAGQCEITAAKKIVLTVGGSSLTLEPAKITLQSGQIDIKGDMKVAIEGAQTEVVGQGTLILKGGVVKIN